MSTNKTSQKFCLRISDISCAGLPRIGGLIKHPGSFYLVATIAGVSRRTNIAERSDNPSWDDTLTFDIKPEGGDLAIQVMARRLFDKIESAGELESPLAILPDFEHAQKVSEQPLIRTGKDRVNAGTVSLILICMKYREASESVLMQNLKQQADASRILEVDELENTLGSAFSDSGAVTNEVKGVYGVWKPLLDKIEVVVEIGNAIAGIDPYARMAWSVISPALKAIVDQRKRDERILHLLDSMNDMYNFVNVANPIRKEDLGKSREEIIKKMLQQTYDCAWFIRDYTSRGFFGRNFEGTMGNHDSIVKQYIETFNKLKTKFQQGSIAVEITVHRTLFVAEALAAYQVLNDMKCATGLDLPHECPLEHADRY